jgi:hypothetical protein
MPNILAIELIVILNVFTSIGSIPVSTKPHEVTVNKTEAYGGKWQISEGKYILRY